MTALRDQPARDRVRQAHDVSLMIEAGAGTGKTTALVDRIVHLVAGGAVELANLAAITFTEAAAAELRDRVRAGLERVVAGGDARHDGEAARDACRHALDQLDEAALTTLHGFAYRILSEHPFEVGLPPGFRMLDPVEESVRFDQRWSAFADRIFADQGLEAALLTWLAADLPLAHLREVAQAFWEYHDRLRPAGQVAPLPPLRVGELVREVAALLALADHCNNPEDRLAQHLDRVGAQLEALANAHDDLDRLRALFSLRSLGCKDGQAQHWHGISPREVRQACADVDKLRITIVTEQRRGALLILADQLRAFAADCAAERRRDGRLIFHDLLVLARDLLRTDPDAWAAATARYRYVLVDEFQDTDPLQIEVAVLLAAAGDHPGSRDWREIPIRPGALVLVGDPKQSIYRFRDADLRVYDDALTRLGLTRTALTENFRSVPSILNVVNTVFERLLDPESGVQPPHVELVAHRVARTAASQVVTFGGPRDARMGEIREHEAQDVAAMVRQILDDGWEVEDPDGTVRAVRAQDIALLIPSRTVLPAMERALDAVEIPVRVESQSLVFATGEIRDLLNILAAVDDPTDELAVVAALRAPAFGCSDAELVEHRTRGGDWSYRHADQPAGPVAEALSVLARFWRGRWWRSVSGTVEDVITECQVLELAAVHRRARDRWRRIRFLLDQAREWDDTSGAGLRGFVEWARAQADEGVRVNEAVAPEPDDPSVRVLTVHGAKGLEFPVVILAGLNALPVSRAPRVLWGPHGPELRVGFKNVKTVVESEGFAAQQTLENRHDDAERLRLLYVAMTRARDYLVISLHHQTPRGQTLCHAAHLMPVLDTAAVRTLSPTRPRRRRPDGRGAEPVEATRAARDAWVAARETLLARTGGPSSVAATRLAEEPAGAPGGDEVEVRPPWQRGRAGTSIGRAVHAVLQTVDLDTGADLDVIARAQAFAEGVPDREGEVRSLAAAVLSAPIVRETSAGGWPHWRELPVAAVVDGVLLEGFVDLLVRTPEGLVVVDYKTDHVASDDALDAAVRRYSVQAAAYALALEAALGEPVERCVFVFARLPEARQVDVVDLAAVVRVARDRLAAIGG